jgi:hypothetical protein
MSSTVRSTMPPLPPQAVSAGTLRWRSWPLVDWPAWSWVVPLVILLVGVWIYFAGGGWLLVIGAILALATSLRTFLLPTTFEVATLGLRRRTLGRVRIIPWQAIRSYQRRPSGVFLYHNAAPTPLDLLNGLFVPFPDDPEELLIALRLYLPHAIDV